MTDDTRKLLTEYLGECWHHWIVAFPDDHTTNYKMRGHKCYYCGEYSSIQPEKGGPIVPRTFSTPADLYAVYSKMVEREEWEDYYVHAMTMYRESLNFLWKHIDDRTFSAWLFCLNCPDQIEERMSMAAKFLKSRPGINEPETPKTGRLLPRGNDADTIHP